VKHTLEELMPTYTYQCDKCGKHFSRAETMSVHGRRKVACPKCESTRVTQVIRSFFAKTAKKS
jgi:putative FmdB family regulatory protein